MHAHCATRTNRKWQTRGCNRGILKMHLGRAGWQGGKAGFAYRPAPYISSGEGSSGEGLLGYSAPMGKLQNATLSILQISRPFLLTRHRYTSSQIYHLIWQKRERITQEGKRGLLSSLAYLVQLLLPTCNRHFSFPMQSSFPCFRSLPTAHRPTAQRSFPLQSSFPCCRS